MGPEVGVLLLRLALVAVLYLFLAAVLLVVARDLGRGGQARTRRAEPPPSQLVVVGAEDGVSLGTLTFDLRDPTIIGRDPDCGVVLTDSFVSTRHAVLRWRARDRRWWVEDLGSTNGTLLNRRPVGEPAPLAFNDVVEVGRVRLKLIRRPA